MGTVSRRVRLDLPSRCTRPRDIGRVATGSRKAERTCPSVCEQSADAGLLPNRRVSWRQQGNHITQGSQGNLVRDIRINDLTLSGSDKIQSLTFGASSILGRGALVDWQVRSGLTNGAPKYSCDPLIHLPLWERRGFELDQSPEATWGKAAGGASLPSSRLATKAACVRFVALSFFRMLRTCTLTVLSCISSLRPISLLGLPSRRRSITESSRGVRSSPSDRLCRSPSGWSSGFAAVARNASGGTNVPPALISLSAATATPHSTDVGM